MDQVDSSQIFSQSIKQCKYRILLFIHRYYADTGMANQRKTDNNWCQ